MLRLLATILLIGGPILALIFRSWGVGSLVFGLGENRSERFIGLDKEEQYHALHASG